MRRESQSAANYVAALSAELADIARQHGLDASAYMLEVAAVEAASWLPDSGNGFPPPVRRVGAERRSHRDV
jgi:hypothetical protein